MVISDIQWYTKIIPDQYWLYEDKWRKNKMDQTAPDWSLEPLTNLKSSTFGIRRKTQERIEEVFKFLKSHIIPRKGEKAMVKIWKTITNESEEEYILQEETKIWVEEASSATETTRSEEKDQLEKQQIKLNPRNTREIITHTRTNLLTRTDVREIIQFVDSRLLESINSYTNIHKRTVEALLIIAVKLLEKKERKWTNGNMENDLSIVLWQIKTHIDFCILNRDALQYEQWFYSGKNTSDLSKNELQEKSTQEQFDINNSKQIRFVRLLEEFNLENNHYDIVFENIEQEEHKESLHMPPERLIWTYWMFDARSDTMYRNFKAKEKTETPEWKEAKKIEHIMYHVFNTNLRKAIEGEELIENTTLFACNNIAEVITYAEKLIDHVEEYLEQKHWIIIPLTYKNRLEVKDGLLKAYKEYHFIAQKFEEYKNHDDDMLPLKELTGNPNFEAEYWMRLKQIWTLLCIMLYDDDDYVNLVKHIQLWLNNWVEIEDDIELEWVAGLVMQCANPQLNKKVAIFNGSYLLDDETVGLLTSLEEEDFIQWAQSIFTNKEKNPEVRKAVNHEMDHKHDEYLHPKYKSKSHLNIHQLRFRDEMLKHIISDNILDGKKLLEVIFNEEITNFFEETEMEFSWNAWEISELNQFYLEKTGKSKDEYLLQVKQDITELYEILELLDNNLPLFSSIIKYEFYNDFNTIKQIYIQKSKENM